MKLSKRKLNRLIQEEYNRLLYEQRQLERPGHPGNKFEFVGGQQASHPGEYGSPEYDYESPAGSLLQHGVEDEDRKLSRWATPFEQSFGDGEPGFRFHGPRFQQDHSQMYGGETRPRDASMTEYNPYRLPLSGQGDPGYHGQSLRDGGDREFRPETGFSPNQAPGPLQEKLSRQIKRYIYKNLRR